METKMNAVSIVRLYAWEMLQANDVMTKVAIRDPETNTVTDQIPIILVEDDGAYADSKKPYIIYGYTETATNSQVSSGTVAFRAVARDYATINRILNTLKAMFEDDFAAQDINNWSSTSANAALFNGIRFTNFDLTYLELNDAPENQAGRREGVISINYDYVVDYSFKRYIPKTRVNGSTTEWEFGFGS